LEFYWPKAGKWVLADVDMHCMFKRDEEYMNFSDLHPMILSGEHYELEPMTSPGDLLMDASDSVDSDFPGMRMVEPVIQLESQRRSWYEQMFAAGALLDENGALVFCSQHPEAGRLKRHPGAEQIVGWQDFVHRFYESTDPQDEQDESNDQGPGLTDRHHQHP